MASAQCTFCPHMHLWCCSKLFAWAVVWKLKKKKTSGDKFKTTHTWPVTDGACWIVSYLCHRKWSAPQQSQKGPPVLHQWNSDAVWCWDQHLIWSITSPFGLGVSVFYFSVPVPEEFHSLAHQHGLLIPIMDLRGHSSVLDFFLCSVSLSGVHCRCFLPSKLEGWAIEVPWTNEHSSSQQPDGE